MSKTFSVAIPKVETCGFEKQFYRVSIIKAIQQVVNYYGKVCFLLIIVSRKNFIENSKKMVLSREWKLLKYIFHLETLTFSSKDHYQLS